jgi:hypothetical protein
MATAEGYDPANDPVALQERIKALEGTLQAQADAKAKAEREAKEKADREAAAANDPAALRARIEKLEGLVTSGIAGSAGGTSAVTGLSNGGEASKTMKRADWQKLSAHEQSKFFRNGGKLTD